MVVWQCMPRKCIIQNKCVHLKGRVECKHYRIAIKFDNFREDTEVRFLMVKAKKMLSALTCPKYKQFYFQLYKSNLILPVYLCI